MPESLRVIKKYPNRRLYDTRTSAYITLVDIRNLVLTQACFKVVDAKTGEDLTRSILLQIVVEEEANGAPLFSENLLLQLIRFCGQGVKEPFARHLETNVRSFSNIQVKPREPLDGVRSGLNAQLPGTRAVR